jgi:hypothetical protein
MTAKKLETVIRAVRCQKTTGIRIRLVVPIGACAVCKTGGSQAVQSSFSRASLGRY